jgi:hypothetical protein
MYESSFASSELKWDSISIFMSILSEAYRYVEMMMPYSEGEMYINLSANEAERVISTIYLILASHSSTVTLVLTARGTGQVFYKEWPSYEKS